MRDAFHHAAISAQGIGAEDKHFIAGAIEIGRLPTRSDCHADAGCDALSQRAGRSLDARCPAIFGMSGATAVELTKTLDVIKADAGLARLLIFGVDSFDDAQMQQTIKQRRSVTHGKHKPIAVRPDWIIRVKTKKVVPERVGYRSHGH